MAVRHVITDRQRLAANLVVAQGMSGTKALRQAGFGRSYSRNLGRALKRSWGLRQAFREQSEQLQWNPRFQKQRIHRYDKRRTAAAITDWALVEEPATPKPASGLPPPPSGEPHEIDRRLHGPPVRCELCGLIVDEVFWSYPWDDERGRYTCRGCTRF